jgi:hypothetical protein
VESSFYQNYKRKFFIGLGALLALTCLALAKYNTFLGVFGFVTLLELAPGPPAVPPDLPEPLH